MVTGLTPQRMAGAGPADNGVPLRRQADGDSGDSLRAERAACRSATAGAGYADAGACRKMALILGSVSRTLEGSAGPKSQNGKMKYINIKIP